MSPYSCDIIPNFFICNRNFETEQHNFILNILLLIPKYVIAGSSVCDINDLITCAYVYIHVLV